MSARRPRLFARVRATVACLAAIAALAAPAESRLHLALKSSSPAAGETLGESPDHFRLTFTAPVTLAFCKISVARGGSGEARELEISVDSGSILVASLPGPLGAGPWDIHWRAAGSDGHPIQGVISFNVGGVPPDSLAGARDSTGISGTGDLVQPGEAPLGVARVLAGRLGRLAVYAALFIAIGAISVSAVVVPRLRQMPMGAGDAYPTVLDGMALTVGVVAGIMLVISALVRTVLAYGDAHSLNGELSFLDFLRVTPVGSALGFSTVMGGLLAASAALARRSRTTVAEGWRLAQIAVVVLFLFFWASAGHSADATVAGIPARIVLVTHVLAAGVWIGTLSVIFVTVMPLALRDASRVPELRATIWSFSPIALGGAALMLLSGALNTLAQVGSPGLLLTTSYGRTVLAKVAVVVLLLGVGAYNWRRLKPRLNDAEAVVRLKSSVRLELTLAAIVLVITSILVAQTPPVWLTGG